MLPLVVFFVALMVTAAMATLAWTDDDWSGVTSVIGYRGDGLTSTVNVDPQSVTAVVVRFVA